MSGYLINEKMRNVLITGGCGFIGSSLICTLLKNPSINIRVVDNLSVGSLADLQSVIGLKNGIHVRAATDLAWQERIAFFECDIKDLDSMKFISKGAHSIIHLAANTGVAPSVSNPIYDCESNVLGTLNLLECARLHDIKKFVFASSGAPLGEQEPPITEKSVPKPASPYGASKLAGEGYCSAYFRTFDVNTVSLRFGNVYGPGSNNKDSAIAKFIKLALAKKTIEIFGDGTQTRDFIYIGDLIEAITLSLNNNDIGGQLFQIATARETSINELITVLKECFMRKGIPFPEIINSERRLGDVHRNYSDTSEAQLKLGWQAKTSLANGLSETLDFFIQKNQISSKKRGNLSNV